MEVGRTTNRVVVEWFHNRKISDFVKVALEDGLAVVTFKNENELEKQRLPVITVTKKCKITCKKPNVPIEIRWLTITGSSNSVVIERVTFECKMQLVGGSKALFKNCTFSNTQDALKSEKQEPCIELFSRSQCEFESCKFVNTKCAVVGRERIECTFRECAFEKCFVGVMLMDQSKAMITDCTFDGCQNHSIYCTKTSQATIKDSNIKGSNGKCILCLHSSTVEAEGCVFEDYNSGGVAVGEGSKVDIKDSSFVNGNGSSIQALIRGNALIARCTFENIKGNAIQIVNGNGIVEDCQMTQINQPAIVTNGPLCGTQCHTIVRNCRIEGCPSSALVARDGSIARFENIEVDRVDADTCSFSDGSSPKVSKLKVSNCPGAVFRVFNGSTPEIESLELHNCTGPKNVICFHKGAPVFKSDCGDLSYELGHMGKITIGTQVKEHDTHVGPNACLCCGKDAEHVRVPCGHRVCDDCYKESPSVCTACRTACSAIVKVFREDKCQICQENPPELIILPCGHNCLCRCCYNEACSVTGMPQCIMCRAKVAAVREDYGT